jgi:hypothetical protein
VSALLERLRIPAPDIRYATFESAPAWVAGRLDGCPKCMVSNNTPALWAISGDTLVCVYQCAGCRHAWWTSWHIPSIGTYEFAL